MVRAIVRSFRERKHTRRRSHGQAVTSAGSVSLLSIIQLQLQRLESCRSQQPRPWRAIGARRNPPPGMAPPAFSSALLACGLCLIAAAIAVQGAGHHVRGGHSRSLRQFRPNPQFPYMRCGNFSTSGLPYYLEGPTWTLDDATGIATYTFQIGYRGPAKEPTPCYTTLEEATHKLMFHVYTECQPALKVAGFNATLNGRPKAMVVYETPLGASLTVTKLQLDSASADGALVSISAAAPCNRPVYLFKPNVLKGVPLEYAFTESSAHKCCPRSV